MIRPVDVTVTVVPHPGWDPAEVEANVVEKLTEVLSPVGWMTPPYGHEIIDPPSRRIHANELIARVDEAMGVDYVESLTLETAHLDDAAAQIAAARKGDA